VTVTTSVDRQPCWSRRAALAVGLAGFALPPARLSAQAAAADAAGLVSGLSGRATATLDGATRTLYRGAVVHRQDCLATAAGAKLKITLADGSTLAIGESSRLVLTSIIDDAGRGHGVVLDLVAGIVRAVLGPSRPEIFEVRGRVAVAAARSTDFFVETESRRTAVFVAAGEVAATETYGDDAALLVAGEGLDIRRGVATGRPVRWGQGRIDDFVARTLVDG
jgi:hypothetical protein